MDVLKHVIGAKSHRTDEWHVEECANDWYSPQEVDGHREKATARNKKNSHHIKSVNLYLLLR